ncbi:MULTISPECIES: endonuclease/exonuclease/phosphatase family protein [unclassified Arthrobacter]|uniref:endonuclease/exonuclease/phosphatase family protein n=1 Tax=unclassified Arthrobacter TaxID=235627 RepID=UPI002DF78F02|nr:MULTISPECIES: endonuclease/exonuclease/phosphatase family protein [unclassified Arthrobacter]MEC5193352.1 endonuclease/exonuclease/phosphatase family metal-dependent hydrolase [Arthrobacter sp. MP_M4]MEC5204818.1 endonuclease/exonuclease/phosphatase family metal-dependent hydrolase [Arthrobacter sp. MP_M7]
MPKNNVRKKFRLRAFPAMILALLLLFAGTPGAFASTPAPSGLKSPAQTSTSVFVSWNAVSGASRYRLQYSLKADFSESSYNRFTTTSTELRGLKSNSTYYLRVRVISADGTTNLSPYSAAVAAKTKVAPTFAAVVNPLSVASYNVKCANCFSGAANELTWAGRRSAVVDTIKKQMPDVIGVQEASQGWLSDDPRPGGVSQFEDLQERLQAAGANYQLTNSKRNNCVKDTTPTACVYADKGASQGTKIFYNASAVSLDSQGSLALPGLLGSTDNPRYMAWAVFTQKSTNKKFFIGDAHLQSGGGTDYQNLRTQQAKAMTAEIKKRNPLNYPVLVTGDMNSHKWTAPSNAPYDTLTAAGFVDPLGNTYASDLPSGTATAETTVGANYDSYNNFNRLANARNAWGNGTYIDYIFTSKMRVVEWRTVVNVDSSGNFIGTIPSDHNMIKATVQLP